MSTTAIIIIVVLVLIVLAILFATVLSPKARQKRALDKERTQAAHQHREVASKRETEAELAERQATERRREAERAEHEAAQRRLDAEQHHERAELHEEGRMDHELDHGPNAPHEDDRGVADPAREPGVRDDARGDTGRPIPETRPGEQPAAPRANPNDPPAGTR